MSCLQKKTPDICQDKLSKRNGHRESPQGESCDRSIWHSHLALVDLAELQLGDVSEASAWHVEGDQRSSTRMPRRKTEVASDGNSCLFNRELPRVAKVQYRCACHKRAADFARREKQCRCVCVAHQRNSVICVDRQRRMNGCDNVWRFWSPAKTLGNDSRIRARFECSKNIGEGRCNFQYPRRDIMTMVADGVWIEI